MHQNGTENKDHILKTMIKHKIPLTRENYIDLAYPDGMPDDAELEAMLPKLFQSPQYYEHSK